ncbi:RagB/SusD family nutrient uptake outer membrane protein [Flavobacterium gilvum]|uniref:RagB/SusD family nutrient uptake outer membrane protein n=1 Tax=Flavobacterium gilvum TaxID=1492737 RepID=A0AAC9I5R9_9FLAO|nr:RagB/SusD family nutrient uptake outer membrane protein [Flavobacterium gilvum]AOW09143.1 hypothetical protein EM308_06285 [Flavobacterium gilvum]KFC60862.1 hypothetical protein FEM08_03490 [Flavobacterium gilvum]
MKKTIIKAMCVLTVGLLAASCNDYMDTSPAEIYNEDIVWGSRQTADAFVYDAYNNVIPAYTQTGSAMPWDASTAMCVFTNRDGYDRNSFNQELTANTSDFGFFGEYAKARKVNLIIENAQKYKGKGLTDTDSKELVATGKLLRALLYFRQARGVGRIVYVDQVLDPSDVDNGNVYNYKLTSTVEESYNLILKDINEALPDLPTAKRDGVLNKWAALALKSEVCLQGAAYMTDLAKRNNFLNQCIAASDDLETNGGFSLTSKFGDMFNENVANAKNEIIFARYRVSSNTGVDNDIMIRFSPNTGNDKVAAAGSDERFKVDFTFEAWGTIYPTQNLADRFLTIDDATGKAVKWNQSSQFINAVNNPSYTSVPSWAKDAKLQGGVETKDISLSGEAKVPGTNISDIIYAKRDARFYGTFVYNNSVWYNEKVTTHFRGLLNTYSYDNDPSHYMTVTNYCYRKYVYNNVQGGRVYYGYRTDYHEVLFRLGRVLLNKAEALLILGRIPEAVTAFNKTRTVHGQLPASTASTPDAAWKDYQTERIVELPMENDIYWSALRWGLIGGAANENQPAKSDPFIIKEEPTLITISKDDSKFFIGKVSYKDINKRDFDESRRFLLPIPKGQLDKNPAYGPQNPGW